MSKPLVLFIDDEEEIINSLRRQFTLQETFDGLFETDPTKVLNLVEDNPVDIVVADIVMPELDGITLLSQIKSKHPSIIRILLTAHGDMDTTVRALNEADVFGFITKPWDRSYLFGHLEMAARVKVEDNLQPRILASLPIVAEATWKDDDGVTITSDVPKNQEQLVKVNINRGFMGAASLFGLDERFENKKYSLPIDEMGAQIRCYVTNKNNHKNQALGWFIISSKLENNQEQALDSILEVLFSSDNSSLNDLTQKILEIIN